jgi:hypothetical protein
VASETGTGDGSCGTGLGRKGFRREKRKQKRETRKEEDINLSGLARSQPSDDVRRSNGSFCVRMLEIEHMTNEILGGVLGR